MAELWGCASRLREEYLHGQMNAIWFCSCFLPRLSARLMSWLRSSKSSASSRKKIGHLNNCSQQGCSFVALENSTIWGCSCPDLSVGLAGCYLSRGVLREVFLKTCDQEWDGPFPRPVSPHISHSASSGGCLTWGLMSLFAGGFVSCLPAAVLPSGSLKSWH